MSRERRAREGQGQPYVDQVLREKRVIVCCGAGGVGKTTTAAALGVAAARAGKRVLVLTIDPARRLSEAMGIPWLRGLRSGLCCPALTAARLRMRKATDRNFIQCPAYSIALVVSNRLPRK